MICLAALIIFAVMGLFSVKYRPIAKESLDCVLRRVTFRPCESNLDQRLRAKAVAKVFKKNERVAGILNRHFEAVAWLFIIITIVSAYFAASGAYNFYAYGNCEGLEAVNGCIYSDVLGGEIPQECKIGEPSTHPT